MRSALLSLLVAATIAACSQSLTHDMTGTGGTGTATSGAGGANPGSGGLGGSNVALCNTLVAEYQSALAAAGNCQVGAPGQCQELVGIDTVAACSCPSYGNGGSVLKTIADAWQAAGCKPASETCEVFCPAALNTTCVSTDGGSEGYCSYVPGTGGVSGAGGAAGAGGSGGTSGTDGSAVDGGVSPCDQYSSEYAAVLSGAKSCTPGATGQCGQVVPLSLSNCGYYCTEFVNDSTVLDSIRSWWETAGCLGTVMCSADIACPAQTAVCVASDAGGSVCATR